MIQCSPGAEGVLTCSSILLFVKKVASYESLPKKTIVMVFLFANDTSNSEAVMYKLFILFHFWKVG
jgi:hypothetical protein